MASDLESKESKAPAIALRSNHLTFFQSNQGNAYFDVTVRPPTGKSAKAANLVFVVDISGSMAGTPEAKVREVLKDIKVKTKDDLQVVVYNSAAYEMKLTAYLEGKTLASGSTHFSCAFTCMHNILVKNPTKSFTFVFMTDGDDTEGNAKKLQDAMTKFKLAANFGKSRTVTVHALGFGSGVKEAFLTSVIQNGTGSGVFRYASESKELGGKFMDLFDLHVSAVACEITFGASPKRPFQAVRIENPPCECGALDDSLNELEQKKIGRACTCLPAYRIEGITNGQDKLQHGDTARVFIEGQTVNCRMEQMQSVSPLTRIRMLELQEPQNEEDVLRIMAELARVIPKRVGFSERLELEQARSELNGRLTEFLALYNQMRLGSLDSSALKLKDLRYEAQFSKVRRQRTVALRQNANLKAFEAMDEKLTTAQNAITTKEWEELAALSDKWGCQLSLDTIHDVMKETSSDFLCLGLLVEREESIIDSPTTGFRLLSVSSTILSYNTFVDAMTRAVAERGAGAAHGGFKNTRPVDRYDVNHERPDGAPEPDSDEADKTVKLRDDQPYAMVGQAREKINAVIPLFLHEAHYRRIQTMLPAWCGYFFTLDPFGYDRNQEVALVTLLGTMLVQHPGTQWYEEVAVGEFSKICTRIVKDSFGFRDKCPAAKYTAFVDTVYGRQKQFFPNLITPLGIAYCMDKHEEMLAVASGEIVAMDEDQKQRHMKAVCLPTCWEAMKRVIMNKYKGTKVESHEIAKQLLYGDGTKKQRASNEEKGAVPWEVQQSKMESDFASYFLDPSDSKIPKLMFDEKTASAVAQSGILVIAETADVKHIIQKYIEPVPKFIKKFYAATKVATSRVEAEQARRHLLLAYFYNSDYPPERISDENVYEYAHAKFVADFENDSKSNALAVYQQSVANAMVECEDLCAFAGMLRVYCPSRANNIFTLTVDGLIRHKRTDKLEALLANEVQNLPLFIGPLERMAWIPNGFAQLQQIRDIVGRNKMLHLESLQRKKGRIRSWRYRESDLPNRHGYHNSKPNPHLTSIFNSYGV